MFSTLFGCSLHRTWLIHVFGSGGILLVAWLCSSVDMKAFRRIEHQCPTITFAYLFVRDKNIYYISRMNWIGTRYGNNMSEAMR